MMNERIKEIRTKLKEHCPTLKFADSWKDCVPIVDAPNGNIGMISVRFKSDAISFGADKVDVECTMTEEEVEKKVLSMFKEFPEFEKPPYPKNYNEYPSCKSDEVWDCCQVQRARTRIARVTRRGSGNAIFDNQILMYVGKIYKETVYDTGITVVDAGIAVAHNNRMYGIATIPKWKDYGVILK
jgi:hypothetical protein